MKVGSEGHPLELWSLLKAVWVGAIVPLEGFGQLEQLEKFLERRALEGDVWVGEKLNGDVAGVRYLELIGVHSSDIGVVHGVFSSRLLYKLAVNRDTQDFEWISQILVTIPRQQHADWVLVYSHPRGGHIPQMA